jgi:SAM-dependent MidA family methyltransferase
MTSSAPRSILPPLSVEEQQHSAAVAARLQEEIAAAGGGLSFERFMELALYAPGLGYYSAGSTKFGAAGDFVTAPEISDTFSRCVARQCAEVLAQTGVAGVGTEILELGAGTGRMAAKVLETLAAEGALPDRYSILEVSADLAQRQRERMSALPASLRERVVWLDKLPERPIDGVILANEVLDALPCQRFVVSTEGVLEVAVATAQGVPLPTGPDAPAEGFVECVVGPGAVLAAAAASLLRELPEPLPVGYTSEICLRVEPWIAGVGACLGRGLMLLFDYGLPRPHYYHSQRVSGTLQCHFKQFAHDDPYINVGVQDITAWVDFTRVAEAGLAAGLDVAGFCTQAAFLLATGIERFVAEAVGTVEQARLAGEARRLLMPGEMGEAFKVMALTRDYEAGLSGFGLQDLRHSL